MEKAMMKVALVQMRNAGTIQNNLKKGIEVIQIAAQNYADLVWVPEVQLTEIYHEGSVL